MASTIHPVTGEESAPLIEENSAPNGRRIRGTFRTNLEYGAARVLLSIVSKLPAGILYPICERLGTLAFRFLPKLRRTGLRNLEIAFPEKSGDERREILRGSFRNLARGLGAFSRLQTAGAEELREGIECSGLENLGNALKSGNGALLFTGHLGSWETTSIGLAVNGFPCTFVVRRIDNPRVETLIDRTRSRFGNRTLDKQNGIRRLFKTLREGRAVGILVDVNMIGNEGVFTDFFGIPASTTFMPARISLASGAKLIPVFAPWDKMKRRYVLEVGEPIGIEPTGDEKADVFALTQLVSNCVETYVRRFPDQWLWIHKRWKTRPEGEPDLYAG